MRRRITMIVIGLLIVLNTGASCRQETAESVFTSFLTAIAQAAGTAIGESLVTPAAP
jgi:hypothetical protein